MRRPNFIDRIPADKKTHFIIGIPCYMFLVSIGFNDVVALILTVVFGIGIEFYQKKTKTGKFEWWDAWAVGLGGLLVFVYDNLSATLNFLLSIY